MFFFFLGEFIIIIEERGNCRIVKRVKVLV